MLEAELNSWLDRLPIRAPIADPISVAKAAEWESDHQPRSSTPSLHSAQKAAEVASRAEPPKATEPDTARVNGPSADVDNRELRSAGEAAIRRALAEVYSEGNRPNLTEVVKPVQARLAAKGLKASKRQIQEIAGNPEFAKQRRKPGEKTARP